MAAGAAAELEQAVAVVVAVLLDGAVMTAAFLKWMIAPLLRPCCATPALWPVPCWRICEGAAYPLHDRIDAEAGAHQALFFRIGGIDGDGERSAAAGFGRAGEGQAWRRRRSGWRRGRAEILRFMGAIPSGLACVVSGRDYASGRFEPFWNNRI